MALFRDMTGRPGPATWVLGSYPDGQDDFPVSGVSWYEAAAFAKFAGKSLPTIYHWTGASEVEARGGNHPAEQLGGAGLANVGQYRGLGPSAPMTWPATSRSGAGTAPATASAHPRRGLGRAGYDVLQRLGRPARDRPGEEYGLPLCQGTCPARNPPEEAFAEHKRTLRDFQAVTPVSDDVFQAVKGSYAYDKTKPLKAKVEPPAETAFWVHERVEVDTAYGSERLIVHLFLPREAAPPYQPVISWPTAGVVSCAPSCRPRTNTWLSSSRAAGPWSVPCTRGRMSGEVQPFRGRPATWDDTSSRRTT